jgi:hypothetical protein
VRECRRPRSPPRRPLARRPRDGRFEGAAAARLRRAAAKTVFRAEARIALRAAAIGASARFAITASRRSGRRNIASARSMRLPIISRRWPRNTARGISICRKTRSRRRRS